MVDTGLLADAGSHRWLEGVTGEEEKLPAAADGTVEIPPYAGHGTFIAGVARCFAPDAAVHVTKVLTLAGATLETAMTSDSQSWSAPPRSDAFSGCVPSAIVMSAVAMSPDVLLSRHVRCPEHTHLMKRIHRRYAASPLGERA